MQSAGMAVQRELYRSGRLTTKGGHKRVASQPKSGMVPLQLDGRNNNGWVYIPKGYNAHTPARLAIMLHGSGGNAEQGLSLLQRHADESNIILVEPASKQYTWDVIASDAFGADVILIDQALAWALEQFAIDAAHIAIGGFSDGASYALSLGLGNGDLFTHIIAFSPGFYYTIQPVGKPNVFISHGVNDGVLPINVCSRRLVPRLQNSGILVQYHEFNGGHEIPAPISKAAIRWFTAG